MKRFLLIFGLYTILFAFVFISSVVIILYNITDPCSISSHEANVRIAANRLDTTQSPKIVIIGGSGCQFGFASGMIAEHFQKPVVNTACHAAIGLRLQINLFKEYLQPGDIVLLIPEYDQYISTLLFYGAADETMLRILCSNYPKGLKYLSPKQWLYVYKYIPIAMAKSKTHKAVETYSPYSVEQLNEYGDAEGWDCRPSVYKDNPNIYTLPKELSEPSAEFIHQFIEDANKENIHVFLLPPALADSYAQANQSFISWLENTLNQREIPFRVKPERYIYHDSLFFDTHYHMNQLGVAKHTQDVIADLDSILLN